MIRNLTVWYQEGGLAKNVCNFKPHAASCQHVLISFAISSIYILDSESSKNCFDSISNSLTQFNQTQIPLYFPPNKTPSRPSSLHPYFLPQQHHFECHHSFVCELFYMLSNTIHYYQIPINCQRTKIENHFRFQLVDFSPVDSRHYWDIICIIKKKKKSIAAIQSVGCQFLLHDLIFLKLRNPPGRGYCLFVLAFANRFGLRVELGWKKIGFNANRHRDSHFRAKQLNSIDLVPDLR